MTDHDALAAYCAELIAENWYLREENRQLRAGMCDLAMATLSPQEARLAQFELHQQAVKLEPIAIKDPRQVPVLRAYEAAVEKFGRLVT